MPFGSGSGFPLTYETLLAIIIGSVTRIARIPEIRRESRYVECTGDGGFGDPPCSPAPQPPCSLAPLPRSLHENVFHLPARWRGTRRCSVRCPSRSSCSDFRLWSPRCWLCGSCPSSSTATSCVWVSFSVYGCCGPRSEAGCSEGSSHELPDDAARWRSLRVRSWRCFP